MERKDTFNGDGELLWIILNDGKKIHFLDVVQKNAHYQKHNHAVGTETRFDWALQNEVGRSHEPSIEIIAGKECELYSIPMDGGTVNYAGFANIMFLTLAISDVWGDYSSRAIESKAGPIEDVLYTIPTDYKVVSD